MPASVPPIFHLLSLFLAAFCLSAALPATLVAQAEPAAPDSVEQGLLPAAGFSIDAGFGIGALYQYQKYDRETAQVQRVLQLTGNAYTEGIYNLRTTYEQRSDSGRRLHAELFAERSQTAAFFGIGAGREFSQQAFDEGFNDYGRLEMLLEVSHGIRLGKRAQRRVKHQRVEWFRKLSVGYNNHYDMDGSLLDAQQPFGAEGGFRQGFHTGIEADLRNHFFRPTGGSFHRIELSLHPSITGNRRTLGKLELETAGYQQFHFLLDVVLAARIQVAQVAGRAPFYELSMLGGEETLRGYPFNRFLDYGSAFTNLELRTWLFSLPFQNIEIGGQLFADGGTLYEYPGAPGWLNDMRGNVGFGGMMSLFNPDFMLRGDFGFSNENFRFFTGLGYVF